MELSIQTLPVHSISFLGWFTFFLGAKKPGLKANLYSYSFSFSPSLPPFLSFSSPCIICLLYACLWYAHVWMQVYMLRCKESRPSVSIIIFYYRTKPGERLVLIRAQWCAYLCPPDPTLVSPVHTRPHVAFHMGTGIWTRVLKFVQQAPLPTGSCPQPDTIILSSLPSDSQSLLMLHW